MIFATPVHFFDVTAQAKAIIDRTFALQPFGEPLRNKVAGIMVHAGSTGIMDAVKSIQAFLNAHRVFVVNWVGIYGPVDDKPQGMEAAGNLGREVVSFAATAPKFAEDFAPSYFAFGTHTH